MTVFQELVIVGIVQIVMLVIVAIVVGASKGQQWAALLKELRHHRECLLAIQEQTGNAYRVLYETYNDHKADRSASENANGGTINIRPDEVGR